MGIRVRIFYEKSSLYRVAGTTTEELGDEPGQLVLRLDGDVLREPETDLRVGEEHRLVPLSPSTIELGEFVILLLHSVSTGTVALGTGRPHIPHLVATTLGGGEDVIAVHHDRLVTVNVVQINVMLLVLLNGDEDSIAFPATVVALAAVDGELLEALDLESSVTLIDVLVISEGEGEDGVDREFANHRCVVDCGEVRHHAHKSDSFFIKVKP
jgi:hypothetical protein